MVITITKVVGAPIMGLFKFDGLTVVFEGFKQLTVFNLQIVTFIKHVVCIIKDRLGDFLILRHNQNQFQLQVWLLVINRLRKHIQDLFYGDLVLLLLLLLGELS